MDARTQLRRFAALASRTAAPAAITVAGQPPAGGGSFQLDGDGTAPTALPPTSRARLRAIAKSAATAYGDWRPAEVTAVPTTHARALASATTGTPAPVIRDTVIRDTVTRDTGTQDTVIPATGTPATGTPVPGDTPVYLVTMTGHFTGERRHRPRGGRAPAARYLSLVINARSFWIMDTGLSRKAPRVMPAALGPVTNIAW